MPSFDTDPIDVYLTSIFSLAVIAVVLAVGVIAYQLECHRRLRPTRAAGAHGPSADGAKPVPTAVGCG
jgi:hypothetical protein